ncbi:MAG TPA: hotdog fold thioesterase [Candidatus Kryptonia bacterium]
MTELRKTTPSEANRFMRDTLAEALGIEITEIGKDYVKGSMPVDRRTRQPFGILHGGASAALAETLGSIGGTLALESEAQSCVGLEINANHVSSVSGGKVYGTAVPLHIGRTTHVWEITIEDDERNLVCISRLTLAVVSRTDPVSK